jgi:hypothetical protein
MRPRPDVVRCFSCDCLTLATESATVAGGWLCWPCWWHWRAAP